MDAAADKRLTMEEARRAQQHNALRGELESDVDRRISAEAKVGLSSEPRIEQVAEALRHKTISEVEQNERDLSKLRIAARASQVVDYLFYMLYALLGLRFALALVGANNNAGFVQFIKGVTQPFYLPFKNIVASPSLTESGATLALPILFAVIVYALLHLGVHGLLRLLAERRTHL